jgi:transposase InsO family protein
MQGGGELWLHPQQRRRLPGPAHVQGARGEPQRLLRLDQPGRERAGRRRPEIRASHEASRSRYGSPRVHAELRAHGRRIGRKRVARLMRGMGLAARRRRRFRRTTDSVHAFPVAPNLLGREFQASAPDRVWLADITYIWTAEGWLCLAAVLDLFSRQVVGWSMADHLGHELALAALDMPLRAGGPRRVPSNTPIAACNMRPTATATGCRSTA